jgi:hypothetical protein
MKIYLIENKKRIIYNVLREVNQILTVIKKGEAKWHIR